MIFFTSTYINLGRHLR